MKRKITGPLIKAVPERSLSSTSTKRQPKWDGFDQPVIFNNTGLQTNLQCVDATHAKSKMIVRERLDRSLESLALKRSCSNDNSSSSVFSPTNSFLEGVNCRQITKLRGIQLLLPEHTATPQWVFDNASTSSAAQRTGEFPQAREPSNA